MGINIMSCSKELTNKIIERATDFLNKMDLMLIYTYWKGLWYKRRVW